MSRELCAAMSLCYTKSADVRWIFASVENFSLHCLTTSNWLMVGGFCLCYSFLWTVFVAGLTREGEEV